MPVRRLWRVSMQADRTPMMSAHRMWRAAPHRRLPNSHARFMPQGKLTMPSAPTLESLIEDRRAGAKDNFIPVAASCSLHERHACQGAGAYDGYIEALGEAQ